MSGYNQFFCNLAQSRQGVDVENPRQCHQDKISHGLDLHSQLSRSACCGWVDGLCNLKFISQVAGFFDHTRRLEQGQRGQAKIAVIFIYIQLHHFDHLLCRECRENLENFTFGNDTRILHEIEQGKDVLLIAICPYEIENVQGQPLICQFERSKKKGDTGRRFHFFKAYHGSAFHRIAGVVKKGCSIFNIFYLPEKSEELQSRGQGSEMLWVGFPGIHLFFQTAHQGKFLGQIVDFHQDSRFGMVEDEKESFVNDGPPYIE